MFESLLLAVDVNDPGSAERVTEAACRLARHEGAMLHVLNVVPDDGMAMVSAALSADHYGEAVEASKKLLAEWAGAQIPSGINTRLHVARGTVYDQIIRMARELDVDGIFVGAHRPALSDYLMGPNAARVARHAPQSVFVIR